ncbi:MAG: hypothetical protein IKL48_04575 [Elusimicrobiaceae bacterium]|nr:hypothetical protein [Elusimicrobiaceae bacterium]
MKKIFLLAVIGAFAVGCSTTSTQSEGLSDQYAKYQIVDQEFDNLIVPNDSYERVSAYEEQVSGVSYIQSTTHQKNQRPNRTMSVKKTVVDGEGNQLSADVTAPVTDQEALPDEEADL